MDEDPSATDASGDPAPPPDPIRPPAGRALWSIPIIRKIVLDHYSMEEAEEDDTEEDDDDNEEADEGDGEEDDDDDVVEADEGDGGEDAVQKPTQQGVDRRTLLALLRVDKSTFEDCVKRIYRVVKRFPSYNRKRERVFGGTQYTLLHYMKEVGAPDSRVRLYSTSVQEMDFGFQENLDQVETAVHAQLLPNLKLIRFTMYRFTSEWLAKIKVALDRESDLGLFRKAGLEVDYQFMLKANQGLLQGLLAPSGEDNARPYDLRYVYAYGGGPKDSTLYFTPQAFLEQLQPQFSLHRLVDFTWFTNHLDLPALIPTFKYTPDLRALEAEVSPMTSEDLEEMVRLLPLLRNLHLTCSGTDEWTIPATTFLSNLSPLKHLTSVTLPVSLNLASSADQTITAWVSKDHPHYPQFDTVYIEFLHGGGKSTAEIAGYFLPFFDLECEVSWEVKFGCGGVPWKKSLARVERQRLAKVWVGGIESTFEMLRDMQQEVEASKKAEDQGPVVGGSGTGWRHLGE